MSQNQLKQRIAKCPVIGSLRSVNEALAELTHSSDCHAAQIAEIIRRDPSLTTRLLRLVNSVFSGLRTPVTDLETAVFYLGLRQIRQLSFSTQFIDEISQMDGIVAVLDWKKMWRHSISTGFLSREILSLYGSNSTSDLDYVIGLVHNIGKIVMAYAFPDEFKETLTWKASGAEAFAQKEQDAFGWNHAEAGAEYLRMHGLSEEIVSAVRWHIAPGKAAPQHAHLAAAVQVSDHLVRYSGVVNGLEQLPPVDADSWTKLDGWKILFPDDSPQNQIARASLRFSIERLPTLLQGMV